MEQPTVIKFPFKKGKFRRVCLMGAFSLVAGLGLLFLGHYLHAMCGFGRLLFGFLGIAVLFTLPLWIKGAVFLHREKDAGVVISDEGVSDISAGNRIGVVQWKDISAVREATDREFPDYRYVVLIVDNPNEYILREPSMAKQRSLVLKMHYYGSPVCISNRHLDTTFDRLYRAIKTRYENYRQLYPDREHSY